MKKTAISHLFRKNTQGKELVGIKVQTNDKGTFVIPVLDSRRSEDEQRKIARMEKNERAYRGSKFMKPTYSLAGYSYQSSKKF